jgi:hypothetical protein
VLIVGPGWPGDYSAVATAVWKVLRRAAGGRTVRLYSEDWRPSWAAEALLWSFGGGELQGSGAHVPGYCVDREEARRLRTAARLLHLVISRTGHISPLPYTL